MKQVILSILCVMLAFSSATAQEAKKKDSKETVTFVLDEMCSNCVKKVEKNIAFEKGVTDLKCDLKSKTVEITYRADKTTEANLVAAFKKLNMDAVAKANAADSKEKN